MSMKPSKCWDCAFLGGCPAKEPCEKFKAYDYVNENFGTKRKIEVLRPKEAAKAMGISIWSYHRLKRTDERRLIERVQKATGKSYYFAEHGATRILEREIE